MTVTSGKIDNIVEIFLKLESNDQAVVSEIQQFVGEQYQDVKESWLVNGLYEVYVQTGSPRCLQLILGVREPHERFLLDRIAEGLRQQENPRLTALTVLGYVIRKQPFWLYKITQHSLMKELIKILKTEDDIVIMMNGLLDLLSLMPIVPVHIATYLQDLFEVFSRLASWRYCLKGLPEIQKIHLQVGLYAFFHRLYGMYPCNFLSYLRAHYPETSKESQSVFLHTIRPMLNSVTMHPQLITHSRDRERSTERWKKMEPHDVIVESSRYSLVSQENSYEDDTFATLELDIGAYSTSIRSNNNEAELDPSTLAGSSTHDMLWTPSKKFDVSTPPPTMGSNPATGSHLYSTLVNSHVKNSQESPPEAAVEATPETTPYVTPIKEDKFKFARPALSSQVSRHLRLDVATYKSPILQPSNDSSSAIVLNSGTSSSSGPESSPFKYPGPVTFERRESLFQETHPTDLLPLKLSTSKNITSSLVPVPGDVHSVKKDGCVLSSLAISSSALLETAAVENLNMIKLQQQTSSDRRPSPINFTNQRPKLYPIQPKPERYPPPGHDVVKNKMLTLDNLKEVLTDYGKEEEDEEVTELTGGSDNPHNDLSTRHITPQMDMDSGATSRTVSRLSTSSQMDNGRKSEQSSTPCTTFGNDVLSSKGSTSENGVRKTTIVTSPGSDNQYQTGGLQTPSQETVDNFVRQMRGRIRYASLCIPSGSFGSSGSNLEVAEEVETIMEGCSGKKTLTLMKTIKKSSSCPDIDQLSNLKRTKELPDETIERATTSLLGGTDPSESVVRKKKLQSQNDHEIFVIDQTCQTDSYLVYPYEHLFPSALPSWFANIKVVKGDYPNSSYFKCASSSLEELHKSTDNPYDILDRYVQSAYAKAVETSTAAERVVKSEISSRILQEEVSLLHNQLLYERHRREVLGMRNRTLLGLTKKSRTLEERNAALVSQLQIVESEISQLFAELESLRRQKHDVEEERALNDKRRDKEIENLMSMNRALKQQKFDLEMLDQQRQAELNSAMKEISNLESALFNAKAEIDRLYKKEESRVSAEKALLQVQKEVLVLGELVRKYREKAGVEIHELHDHQEVVNTVARLHVENLQNELVTKSEEVEAYKSRINDLEKSVGMKESAMIEQKRLLKKVKEEYEEKLKNCNSSYTILMKVQSQLEVRILELQDQLFKASRGGKSSTSSHLRQFRGHTGSSVVRGAGPSPKLNFASSVTHSDSSIYYERAFTVGSPPSSSGGSYGSDHSEVFRHGMEPRIGSSSPSDRPI